MAAKSVGLGFLVLLSAGVFYTCDPGWLFWSGSCYILLPDKMDWEEGRNTCESRGSKMVLPNSQEEHEFIWRKMKVRMLERLGANSESELELWIGCREKNKTLTCLGKEGYEDYVKWGDGEPNTADGDECVRLTQKFDGKWGDITCSHKKFAACEMRAPPRRSYCLQADSSGRFTSQCLLNHVIKNLTTTGVIGCGRACWAEPRCHSFSILGQDAKMRVCQLNDATRYGDHVNVIDFGHVENCIHFEL